MKVFLIVSWYKGWTVILTQKMENVKQGTSKLLRAVTKELIRGD